MSVFKDSFTGSWACKFRYKNWQGITKQHKKTGFKTQKEAKEYEKAFLDKEQNSCDMTFNSLYEYYMEDCNARMKPKTMYEKKTMFEVSILPYFGKLRINAITPANIRQWQTKLINSERYKQTTLRTLNAQLSAIFNFAVRIYGLQKNPCKLAGTMGSAKGKEMEFWTIEEFNKFLETVQFDIEKTTFFMLLFYSGLRIGEAMALTIKDFDFSKNTVTIDKNYTIAGGKKYIGTTKTVKGNRKIALPQTVMNKVKEYYFQMYDKNPANRLFTCHPVTYKDYLDKGSKQAGLKRIRIHDLRHSHASMLINMGVPVKQISERLGHEDISITLNTYSHLYKEKEDEMVAKLEAMATTYGKVQNA